MALWTPANAPTGSVRGWISSQRSTIVKDASNRVSSMSVLSEEGGTIGQIDYRPTHESSVALFGGRPAIGFGGGQFIRGSFDTGAPAGTPTTGFAVATLNSFGPAWGRLLSLSDGGQDWSHPTAFIPLNRQNNNNQIISTQSGGGTIAWGNIAYSTPFVVGTLTGPTTSVFSENGTLGADQGPVAYTFPAGNKPTMIAYGSQAQSSVPLDPWSGYIAEGLVIIGDYAQSVTTGQGVVPLHRAIEGYLHWEWGLESLLPIGHPFKNEAPTVATGGPPDPPPPTGIWQPTNEPSCVGWWDGKTGKTISGVDVSVWASPASNLPNLIQPNTSFDPINGVNHIQWTLGANQWLDAPSVSASMAKRTYVAVVTPEVPGNTRTICGSYDGSGNFWGGLQFRVESDGRLGLVRQGQAWIGDGGASNLVPEAQMSVVVGWYDDTTGAYGFRCNGVQWATGVNDVNLEPGRHLVVGTGAFNGENWIGKIWQLRAYDQIFNEADLQKIEAEAAWIATGSGALLPTGHPHKTLAPGDTADVPWEWEPAPGLVLSNNNLTATTTTASNVAFATNIITETQAVFEMTFTGGQWLDPAGPFQSMGFANSEGNRVAEVFLNGHVAVGAVVVGIILPLAGEHVLDRWQAAIDQTDPANVLVWFRRYDHLAVAWTPWYGGIDFTTTGNPAIRFNGHNAGAHTGITIGSLIANGNFASTLNFTPSMIPHDFTYVDGGVPVRRLIRSSAWV